MKLVYTRFPNVFHNSRADSLLWLWFTQNPYVSMPIFHSKKICLTIQKIDYFCTFEDLVDCEIKWQRVTKIIYSSAKCFILLKLAEKSVTNMLPCVTINSIKVNALETKNIRYWNRKYTVMYSSLYMYIVILRIKLSLAIKYSSVISIQGYIHILCPFRIVY